MAKCHLLWLSLFLLLSIALTFQVDDPQQDTPIIKDARGNITDEEFNSIKGFIAAAEQQYGPTDFEKIAAYIANNTQNISPGAKYNVYVHEGPINQLGFNTTTIYAGKYMWLVNYGKYRSTYTLIGVYAQFCQNYQEVTGGSSAAQFGAKFTEADQHLIYAVLNNGILYRSNDIAANAFYIQQKLNLGLGYYWQVIITDPNVRYGYHVCRTMGEKWFALRGYQQFKWNYFGNMSSQ